MGQASDTADVVRARDAETLLAHAERLLRMGEAVAALMVLENGRAALSPAERPYVDHLRGLALLALDRCGEAYTMLQVALADPTIEGDDAAHAFLLNVLGNIHHADGHFQAATEAFGRALRYAERVQPPDDTLCARLLVNLGSAALKSGQVEPATTYYERAVVAARRTGEMRRLGMAHMGLGLARQQARDSAAALAHAEEALRLFAQTGDTRLAAQSRTNLALVYVEQGAWDAAMPHLQRVLEQARAGDEPTVAAHALELLARVHAARGSNEGAAKYAAEARTVAERAGDLLEAHIAGVTEAAALVVLGRLGEADDLYRWAIDYFCDTGVSRHLISASHDYAKMLRSWGRGDEALDVLDRAYACAMNARQG